MRKLLAIFFFSLISSGSFAADESNGSASSFIKADFKQEIAAPKLSRLLGTGGGLLFVSKEGGIVQALTTDGEVAYTLATKAGEVQLLKRPEAVAVAGDLLYVVDSGTQQVLLYALADGKFQERFGASTGGFFGGGDKQGLDSPRGIAVHEGVVYVADTGNRRIQLFGVNGVFLHTLELSAPAPVQGDRELPYKLDKAVDIALDDAGRVYVLDTGDALVKVYDASGLYLRSFAGIASPVALTVASDGVYVADERAQAILKFDFEGKLAYQFGSRGDGKSQSKKISGLANGKGQQVFIGDAGKSLINVFQTVAGVRIEPIPRAAGRTSVEWLANIDVEALQLAGDGKGVLYAIANQDKEGLLLKLRDGQVEAKIILKDMQPVALALDIAGNIWVADKKKKRVVKLDESGTELLGVGSSGSGAGQFNNPSALAVASTGLIFVADRVNRSVQVFREDGVFLKKLGGNQAKIENPIAMGIDEIDDLFILDAGRSSVVVYSASGEFKYEFGKLKEGSEFVEPLDMAVTPDEVLVLDGPRIKAFDHQGKLLRVFGTKATGAASLGDSVALASSGGSTLFVSDPKAKRVVSLSVLYKPRQLQQFEARPGVHAVELHWAKPRASYINAFRIYRSKVEDAAYVRVATTETNSYSDTGLEPGTRYFYRVAAVSDADFEGASSTVASATPEKYLPPVPVAVTAETNPWQAKLKWDEVDPQYFAAYRVYQKEGENFIKIGEVAEPAFVKDGLQPETKYTFYVSVLSSDNTESDKVAVEAKTEVFNRPPLEIEVVRLNDVFSNSYKLYERDGVGVIRLTNNTDRKMEKIHVSFVLKNFMDFATESKVSQLLPGESEELPLMAVFNNSILTMSEDSAVQVLIEASYFDNGKRETYGRNATVNVYDKHRLTWDERGRFAVFVTPKDEPILNLARLVVGEYKETKDEAQLAAALFDAF
ncbi:MAG: fibronectin type III domain-containing protein, partial [Sideroxydans sp.]